LFSVDVKIITRGRRSLGYGFVEFATEEEAKKAIVGMDQKQLDGRTLNVEKVYFSRFINYGSDPFKI
jgi:RNA recognition motif-containing protein